MARWYEDQMPGLGGDLMTEVEHWLDAIPEAPLAWLQWPGVTGVNPPIRRALLRRFLSPVSYQVFRSMS
jgi:hypothetical protein